MHVFFLFALPLPAIDNRYADSVATALLGLLLILLSAALHRLRTRYQTTDMGQVAAENSVSLGDETQPLKQLVPENVIADHQIILEQVPSESIVCNLPN